MSNERNLDISCLRIVLGDNGEVLDCLFPGEGNEDLVANLYPKNRIIAIDIGAEPEGHRSRGPCPLRPYLELLRSFEEIGPAYQPKLFIVSLLNSFLRSLS